MMNCKPYPAYKDSAVKWLGRVPDHWEEKPLTSISKLKSLSGYENEELLSVYLERGVIKFSEIEEKRTNVTSTDLSKYQLVEPGDFVLNNQQAWRGSVGVSKHRGIVSPAYIVLSTKGLNPDFANYYLRSDSTVAQYLINSKGVGTIQRNLYWPSLKRATLVIPPIPEQTAIANFLDDKTAKIDRAIAQKERLIALLKERKQILIQNAVTKGLDPTAKMKDSGIEWIGEIPEHWEVLANKYVFELKKTQVGKRASQYDLLSLTLRGVIKRDMENPQGKFPAEFDTYQEVFPGDFVFCLFDVEETPRGVGLAHDPGMITGAYTVMRPKPGNDPRFLEYFYLNLDTDKRLKPLYKGLRNTIPKDTFFAFKTFLPPRKEQEAISDFLDEMIEKNGISSANLKKSIQKLREYRATLIDSAVTGKIKVPGV